MTNAAASADPKPALTQGRIFLFWLPLAASWLLMAVEMPFAYAVMARLNEAKVMIAAFGIVASLSITIESPVIPLLATSTALARSRQNYQMLRRFTLHLMAGTTILHILLGWTPLFDLVVDNWMGVPEDIIEPIRLGMRIMILWSAAIGWRRFTQGVLIRHGYTRFVGQGTAIRLLSSAGTALGLFLDGRVPGVAVGAIALTVGVLVEAGYATWAARKLIAEKFGPEAQPTGHPDLSYGELVRFHTPLAASTMLMLFSQPLISAALARTPDPKTALAAWPVTGNLLFLTRAPVYALPEVIIALFEEPNSLKALRAFALRAGLICFALLALLSFTPLGFFYFQNLIGVSENLAVIAVTGTQIGILIPVAAAFQAYFRGILTARKTTFPITISMLMNLITMAVVLTAGVALNAPGLPVAALALTLAITAESITMFSASRRREILPTQI